MERPKLALLAPSLTAGMEGGGWTRYAQEIIRALKRQDIYELLIFSEGERGHTFLFEGITVYEGLHATGTQRPLARRLASWSDANWLHKKVRGAVAVHALAEHHAFSAGALGIPFFVTAHGTYLPRYLSRGTSAIHFFKKAAGIICVSEFTKSHVLAAAPMLMNLSVITNGVDTTLFTVTKGYQDRPLKVITVGALKSRKGQDTVLRALAQLHNSIPELQYEIVGDQSGPFFEKLKSYVNEHHLENAVIFRSGLTDAELVSAYNDALACILLSREDGHGGFEGFGLSLLEAAACGTPMIGTRGGGAEHLIHNGRNGFLLPADDAKALAEKIEFLIGGRDEAARMGWIARGDAERQSWDVKLGELLTLYKKAGVPVA